jgi:hypothetical protein
MNEKSIIIRIKKEPRLGSGIFTLYPYAGDVLLQGSLERLFELIGCLPTSSGVGRTGQPTPDPVVRAEAKQAENMCCDSDTSYVGSAAHPV